MPMKQTLTLLSIATTSVVVMMMIMVQVRLQNALCPKAAGNHFSLYAWFPLSVKGHDRKRTPVLGRHAGLPHIRLCHRRMIENYRLKLNRNQ